MQRIARTAQAVRWTEPDATLHIPAGVVAQAFRDGARQARLMRLLEHRRRHDDRCTRRAHRLRRRTAARSSVAAADAVDASVVVCARSQAPERCHERPRGSPPTRSGSSAGGRVGPRPTGGQRRPNACHTESHELGPDDPRHRGADRAARARALHRRQGRGHARRALLAVLPADARRGQTRRDRVRDRRDPRGRLREDHRHEPRGDRGARPGGRRPRLLQPGAVEADRRDPRRARREPR